MRQRFFRIRFQKDRPVFQDLFAAGVDHRLAHGLDLFRSIHVFGDNAPFEIFPVIVALVLEYDDGVATMAQCHEMDAGIQVECDLSVMG